VKKKRKNEERKTQSEDEVAMAQASSSEDLRVFFQAVDVDNSGSINAAELQVRALFLSLLPFRFPFRFSLSFSSPAASSRCRLVPQQALESGNLHFNRAVVSQMIK
jgi:hypothetical protein